MSVNKRERNEQIELNAKDDDVFLSLEYSHIIKTNGGEEFFLAFSSTNVAITY